MDNVSPENSTAAFLDKLRREDRSFDINLYYRSLLAENKNKAVGLINEKDLCFCTLYMLKKEIIRYGLLKCMNYRNLQALIIAKAIHEKNSKFINLLISRKRDETKELLEWILITGAEEDGLDNNFDEILELCATLLVRYYRDTTILPLVADMIFKRKRKGLLIHSLVWAFFEAHDPSGFLHIAKYLRSGNQIDLELALRLLNFIPCVRNFRAMNSEDLYESVYHWLSTNSPYLRPTGECLHLTANPIPFVVHNT